MIQDLSLCFIVKFDCFIFKYLKTLAVLKPKLKICTVKLCESVATASKAITDLKQTLTHKFCEAEY